jgi:endonuclease YncB( thermonuclease family)
VTHKGREYIFRLYFVDAPEADASLTERAVDQAAYFGVAAKDIPRGGRLAAEFTRQKLAGRDFTVVTRWRNAMGRSKLARFYSVVLVRGENLAEELVANGWARIYGLKANWPDGPRSTTFINKLKNMELGAREKRLGMWNTNGFKPATFPAASAAPNYKARKGSLTGVDLNESSFEELQSLPGIGPVLAERIMANRPYHNVDDLLKVNGVGAITLGRLKPLIRVERAETEK